MPPSASSTNGDFEVIVVGSGAGGGPLAARLAEAGVRVLLLEAGSDVGGSLAYQVPAMHAVSTELQSAAWWYFVGHHADSSLDAEDSKYTPAGILYPRGSALGGSTAVNAMVTVLPSPSDWDGLAVAAGEPSYRAHAMAPYYGRVREWLSVEVPDPALALNEPRLAEYLSAAASAHAGDTLGAGEERPLGLSGTGAELTRLLSQDVNETLRFGETTGLYRLPLATREGRRNGTRERLVETVGSGHPLTIYTEAFVTKVLWDRSTTPPRALGVEYVDGAGLYGASIVPNAAPTLRRQVFATREVVLAAGAFNSPQLLMLSGVGDAEDLAALGIDSVIERPGVGRNLQDRYEVPVVTELPEPVSLVASCDLLSVDPTHAPATAPRGVDPCLDDWQRGEGVYRTPGFLASVLRRSSASAPLVDLQVFAAAGDARGYYPGYSADAVAIPERFSWLVLKAHTNNHDGTVRLTSADPFEAPEIRFNYFDEGAPLADPDLLAVVEGVKFIRRIQAEMSRSAAGDGLREVWPGPAVASDRQIAEWARREAWGHHACCTNPMGTSEDPDAVVDAQFRVIGAAGLRVVDASVFPEIPGTFIALPIFMMSERAADVMLEELR